MTQEDDLFGADETARSAALDDLKNRIGGNKVLLTYILQHIRALENP